MTAILSGIFFASGSSALILETLWFRQAGLAFGNSVWASSLVLAGFMAGLGLGNALASRYGDRLRNPLCTYAIAEIAIAVTGVGLVYLFPAAGAALAPMLRPLFDQPVVLNTLRLLIAFLLLLVPATAMGLTLPLLTRTLMGYDGRFGSVLGRLYGWNTLGAVVGVVVGELYLVAALGVRGTAIAAGALNLAAAAIAGWLSRRLPPEGGSHISLPPRQRPRKGSLTGSTASTDRWLPALAGSGRPWLLAAFLSGFALLALEVVWFRLLLLVVMGHSTAFALMLAVVLAGIAGGGLIAAAWLRRSPDAHRMSAIVAFAAAVFCVVSYAVLPAVIRPFETNLADTSLEILRAAIPLMLPVSLLSGVFFTLVGAALNATQASETQTTGRLTLANTIGAAVGSLASGFVFLPVLGMELSLALLAGIYALVGVVLGPVAPRRTFRYAAAACAVVLVLFPFGAMKERLLEFPVKRYAFLRNVSGVSQPSARVAALREGLTETIQFVEMSVLGTPMFHQMLTNAISMADTEYFSRRYMKLYVYWPLAAHPDAKRALLIGYGVGNTAKALTDTRSLTSIDVVDISRDVLDMSGVVFPGDTSPLRDPRVQVHVEDGRYFLQTTTQRFDLITAEPPPPTVAGAVNLYTREYFRLIRDRLDEGGIATYWLPLHVLSDASTKSVLRAFCDVFADCSLWHGSGAQLMMVGTRGAAGPVSAETFVRQWRDPTVAVEMKRLGLERPEQLGALFIGDAEYISTLIGATEPLTDDHPKRIEAPLASKADADRFIAAITASAPARERFHASVLIRRVWPESLIAASDPYFEVQDAINAFTSGAPTHIRMVHDVLTRTPLTTPALWLLGSDWDLQRVVTEAPPAELAQPPLQFHLGVRLIAERSYAAAVGPLSRSERLPELRQNAFAYRVYALCMSGRVAEAQRLVSERRAETRGEFWEWIGQTFAIEGLRN